MFTKAIVRKPGINFADGITSADEGRPDFLKALEQHASYCDALRQCGLKIFVLEADERFPDGCFVEDTAVVAEQMAVITKPGDPSRAGEEKSIAEILGRFRKLEWIEAPGNLEGGDIMQVNNHFYIGVSKRTNSDGARQLATILSNYGYTSSNVPVETVLHLKTGVTYLGNNNFIAVDEFSTAFAASNVIELSPDEYYHANCLLINGHLLVPKGYPNARREIEGLEYQIIEVEMSEYRKMDGGLTCLSLLF